MVIYEISKRIFHLSSRESFFLGIIVCSNSFVLYIAFKHFLSELIALVFFTGGLLSAYELGYNKASPIKKTILMMPILIGLLICYQSAVIIFYLYLALAIIIFSLKIDIKRKKLIGLKTSFKNFIFFSLSILFTFMLLPQELKCVIDRIGVGLHASFGWPLDFLSFYQLVVPSLFMFPSNTQSYFAVELLFDLIFLGIIAQILWTVKRSNEKLFWVITKFLVLILLAILGYLVMSSHFGASYQTWKFASYLFIPLGFIMPILFIKTSALSKWLFIILNIICLHKQYKHFNPRNISNEIQEFKVLKASFPKEFEGKTVVLKLSTLNDQIADTLLNDKFKLVSKALTGANNFDNCIKTLNAENTYVLFKPEKLSIKESKVMTLTQYSKEVKLTLNKKFLFSNLDSYDSIQLIKGFSSAESWGVWTESKEAILELKMPENLVKCDLVLLFKIRPFLSQKNNHQDFSIFINDHFIKDVTLSSDAEISVKLPSKDLSRNSKIRLRFYVKNPISPHDIDIKLLDTRKLALGFISMKINKDSI